MCPCGWLPQAYRHAKVVFVTAGCIRARAFSAHAQLRSPRRCVSTTSPHVVSMTPGRGAASGLLAQARQARPQRRYQQGKRAAGGGRHTGALPAALRAHRVLYTLRTQLRAVELFCSVGLHSRRTVVVQILPDPGKLAHELKESPVIPQGNCGWRARANQVKSSLYSPIYKKHKAKIKCARAAGAGKNA